MDAVDHSNTHGSVDKERDEHSEQELDGHVEQGCDEDAPRRPPSVYHLLCNEDIAKIHDTADLLFDLLDRNGDESISKVELATHLLLARYEEKNIETLFDMIDVDGSGDLSRVELREAFVRYPPLRSAPGMGFLANDQQSAVHEEADATFTALDTDDNGVISQRELERHFEGLDGPTYSAKAVEKIFNAMDSNSDGEISRSEFRSSYVRHRAMRIVLGIRQDALGLGI